jgi:hypothetical protein
MDHPQDGRDIHGRRGRDHADRQSSADLPGRGMDLRTRPLCGRQAFACRREKSGASRGECY